MLLLCCMTSSAPKSFIIFSMSCNCVTSDCDICNITSHSITYIQNEFLFIYQLLSTCYSFIKTKFSSNLNCNNLFSFHLYYDLLYMNYYSIHLYAFKVWLHKLEDVFEV